MKFCKFTGLGENLLTEDGGSYSCTCAVDHAPDEEMAQVSVVHVQTKNGQPIQIVNQGK